MGRKGRGCAVVMPIADVISSALANQKHTNVTWPPNKEIYYDFTRICFYLLRHLESWSQIFCSNLCRLRISLRSSRNQFRLGNLSAPGSTSTRRYRTPAGRMSTLSSMMATSHSSIKCWVDLTHSSRRYWRRYESWSRIHLIHSLMNVSLTRYRLLIIGQR